MKKQAGAFQSGGTDKFRQKRQAKPPSFFRNCYICDFEYNTNIATNMTKSSETRRGGYQTPECEVISLIYNSSVIMSSPGSMKTSIEDWGEDDADEAIYF